MPTIPPAQRPPSEREIREYQQAAKSFGADAERYNRSRPDYPDAMVRRIVAASPGPHVLDVGCGTGIAARQFHAAGCDVLGVDVDERMAGLARQRGFEVEVAEFESWDPAGRTFDAVVAGQAWHWVDAVAGAAKAAEALRPGGRLALFWNVGQPPPEAADAFAEVYRRVLPDSPMAGMRKMRAMEVYSVMFASAEDGIRQAAAFGEPERWPFEWERLYTRDEWLEQLPTQGALTRLPRAKLDELLAATGAAIDALGGGFTMHYTAVVVTTARDG
jgi:SAM-dependent methyltransferase